MDSKKISLSILTYNRPDRLCANLREIAPLLDQFEDVIVVDNSPGDETRVAVTTHFPNVRYMRNDRNIGAVGRNCGMMAARGDFVITLDDDVIGLTLEHCQRVIELFVSDPGLGAIVFRSIHHANRATCNWCHHCKSEEFELKTFRTYEICEGTVAYRKEALEAAGYYWEPLFISHEGLDLSIRLYNVGYSVLFDGAITVVHHMEEGGRLNWRRYYYDTRNQIWVAVRHMPWWEAVKYLARGQLSMLVYAMRDGYAHYWLKAIIDGVAGARHAYSTRTRWSGTTQAAYEELNSIRAPFFDVLRRRLFRRGIGI